MNSNCESRTGELHTRHHILNEDSGMRRLPCLLTFAVTHLSENQRTTIWIACPPALLTRFSAKRNIFVLFATTCFLSKNTELYLDGLKRWKLRWEQFEEAQGWLWIKKHTIFKKKCLVSLLGLKLFSQPSYIDQYVSITI